MVKIDRAAHTSGDLISKISELEAKRLKMSGAVRTQPYVLFGLGGVGRGLLRALLDASDKHQAQYGVGFAALALCDSRGALGDCKAAIAPAAVRAAHDAKEAGGELASAGPAYVARGAGVSAADFLEGVVDSVLGAGHAELYSSSGPPSCTCQSRFSPCVADAMRGDYHVWQAASRSLIVFFTRVSA